MIKSNRTISLLIFSCVISAALVFANLGVSARESNKNDNTANSNSHRPSEKPRNQNNNAATTGNDNKQIKAGGRFTPPSTVPVLDPQRKNCKGKGCNQKGTTRG